MSNSAHVLVPEPTAISADDVRRFHAVATIHDEAAFARSLQEFLEAKSRASASRPGEAVDDSTTLRAELKAKAGELEMGTAWKPSVTDVQRGRLQMLKEFNAPHNLSLARFAALANKSRQQIYKDVSARRLLSLGVGKRGQRIPDWQLDDVRSDFTRRLLAEAADVDEWTLFHALSRPLASLDDKIPIEIVNKSNMNQVLRTVLASLGVHG